MQMGWVVHSHFVKDTVAISQEDAIYFVDELSALYLPFKILGSNVENFHQGEVLFAQTSYIFCHPAKKAFYAAWTGFGFSYLYKDFHKSPSNATQQLGLLL